MPLLTVQSTKGVITLSKRIAYYGLFAALAIIVGYIEAMFPLPVGIPGVKLGLANVVVLTALYVLDVKSAFYISLVRIFISALLFKGFGSLIFSASGALLSFIIMSLIYRFKSVSPIGVSILGGIAHNIGQLIAAGIVISNLKIVYYVPVLLLSGVITGFLTGLVVKYVVPHLKNFSSKI
ncbi:MAG: Gx transporter family protein [Firmicutes bacterium]|nr:Gx transporter family protein [Bacillota bacterium]